MTQLTYRIRVDGVWHEKDAAVEMINRADMAFYQISIRDIEPPAGMKLRMHHKTLEPEFFVPATIVRRSGRPTAIEQNVGYRDAMKDAGRGRLLP